MLYDELGDGSLPTISQVDDDDDAEDLRDGSLPSVSRACVVDGDLRDGSLPTIS